MGVRSSREKKSYNNNAYDHDSDDYRGDRNKGYNLTVPTEQHNEHSRLSELSGYHGNSPLPKPRKRFNDTDTPLSLRINASANNALSSDGNYSEDNDESDEELQISDETENDRARIQDQYRKTLNVDATENKKDISKSDVDLRKHKRQLDNLRPNPLVSDKRSTSLSRADVEETLSRLEEEDALADLRTVDPPRHSALSPTPASRQNSSNSLSPGYSMHDRPWSARDAYRGYDGISERSMASTTALFQLSTQNARNRLLNISFCSFAKFVQCSYHTRDDLIRHL